MVLQSSLPSIVIPQSNFAKNVFEKLASFGDKTALVEGSSGRSYSFSDFCALSKKCAAALYKLGVRRGDVVAVCCSNKVEFLSVVLGAQSCGSIATTCNPSLTKDEITNQLAHSEPKVVFMEAINYAKIKDVAREVTSIKMMFTTDECDDCTTFYQLINEISVDDFPSNVESDLDDVILLLYSSGTSGLPKGIMHTNSTLNAMFHISRIALRFSPLDVTYLAQPLFNIYGLYMSLLVLQQGAKVVLEKQFDIKDCFQAIEKHQEINCSFQQHYVKNRLGGIRVVVRAVTYLFTVPSIIVEIEKSTPSSSYDLTSLRSIFTGAAPLPVGVAASLLKKLNLALIQAWGMTEGVPLATTIDKSYPMKSVGTICPNTLLKVLDIETKKELSTGQNGELCVKGPQIMKGYFKNPAAAAICMDSDGWLHTGDIGHYDSDGFVYIVDRAKELIKYKGHQIAPVELEDILLCHPKVAEAGVIGILDSESGEVPKAFVVRKDASLRESELQEYMKGKVVEYKQLKGGIVFVSSMPKNPSGKILRRALREM